MDDLEEVSNPVVEFHSTWREERFRNSANKSVATDPLPDPKEQQVQSTQRVHVAIQTEARKNVVKSVDDKKLAHWLCKIYPVMELELNEGITHVYDAAINVGKYDLFVKPYQKISTGTQKSQKYKKHGTATWLAVSVNNIPALAISTSVAHSNWCQHVEETVTIFVPKRDSFKGNISYSEEKQVTVKSCIKTLGTNSFDKSIFAGGSFSGDVYIWEFKSSQSSVDVTELFFQNTECGPVVGIVWLTNFCLLTCHEDGFVCMWQTTKTSYKDKCFRLSKNDAGSSFSPSFTTIVDVSPTEFMIGTHAGTLFLCSILKYSTDEDKENCYLITTKQESHSFHITSLLRASLNGVDVVISCDVSGNVLFHNIRNFEDGPMMSYKIPSPFKSYIASTNDAQYIFSPVEDGSLDIFGVQSGTTSTIQGACQGKGIMIRTSDNGNWIVTGCYEGWFQIFTVEQK